MNRTLVIGVDPDKDTPAFASVMIEEDLSIKVVGVKIQLPAYGVSYMEIIPQCDPWTPVRVFVESPEAAYTKGKGIRVQDIVELARRAGECAMYLQTMRGAPGYPSGAYDSYYVTPAEWKGQAPKGISQARICRRLGWNFKQWKAYCQVLDFQGQKPPAGGEALLTPNAKHLLDAIGIALWGADTIVSIEKRRQAMERANLRAP